MNNIDVQFRVVVAIDFGTTFSGYAYCFLADPHIHTRKSWPSQGYKYPKTPTYLLYHDQEFDSWGYKAKKRLAQQRGEQDAISFYSFEKFKTLLYERNQVGEDGLPYVETEDGKKFSVIDLISDYLREIRLLALEDIKDVTHDTVEDSEIRWCLTVPAIWDDAAKQFMEKAAIKAGIISSDDTDSQRFLFALEPEAAAVYCFEVDKLLGQTKNNARMMIVDCGGGTVDLTVHEIITESKEKGLKEVVPGSGKADGHGGKDVDTNFLLHLGKIIGRNAIVCFEEKFPDAYLEMMEDWEEFKCGFDPDDYGDRGKFRLPSELRELLDEEILKRLADNQNGDNHTVWISRAVMEKEIFGPVISNILNCVESQFKKLDDKDDKGCDYLYLVGGFSTSPLLRQRIEEKFGNRVTKIIKPSEPGGAIVAGAASFGRNPDVIRARRSRLTYGTDCSIPFVDGLDSNKKFFNQEKGIYCCHSVFSTFVTAGESVPANSEVGTKFGVGSAYQKEAHFGFYATPNKEVLYVDEPGVTKIGEAILPMPFTTGGLDRAIEVIMYFGETKIRAKARDLTQGSDKEIELHLDFSPTYSSEEIGK